MSKRVWKSAASTCQAGPTFIIATFPGERSGTHPIQYRSIGCSEFKVIDQQQAAFRRYLPLAVLLYHGRSAI
ncbi:MAG: hypothetical protein U0694_21175 [Anaerolineae bacterium]